VNRRAVIVGVAGVVVLTLLWWFLAWSPQGKRLDAAEERREAAAQTNSQLQVTLDRLRDLEARRPELEDDLTRLRRAVPDQPQLARFLLSADEAANRSGVELTTVTPSRPAEDASAAGGTTATTAAAESGSTTTTAAAGSAGDTTTATTPAVSGPSSIDLSFNVSGGYFQLLDFLNRVDDLPRIVVVDSLDISSSSGEGAEASDTTADSPSTSLIATITARMFTGAVPAATDAATAGGATATTAAPASSTENGDQS
jgi:Tfp pilus assembly protein PilO